MIRRQRIDVPTGAVMTLAVARAFREHAVLIAVVIAQSLDTLNVPTCRDARRDSS
jgi:hypothetical protein